MTPTYPLGVNIGVAGVGGVVYAVFGKCVHLTCILFTRKLNGHTITCPCHDWRFDVRTGIFGFVSKWSFILLKEVDEFLPPKNLVDFLPVRKDVAPISSLRTICPSHISFYVRTVNHRTDHKINY